MEFRQLICDHCNEEITSHYHQLEVRHQQEVTPRVVRWGYPISTDGIVVDPLNLEFHLDLCSTCYLRLKQKINEE